MGIIQSVQRALYSFITKHQIVFYIFPVFIPMIKRATNSKRNANYFIVDKSGNSIPACKVDDRLFPAFGVERLKSLPDIEIRDNDVMLCGYPKTGCHWVHEILFMLVNNKAQLTKFGKGIGGMIDVCPNLFLDSMPSPRILNTHVLYDQLPRGIREKGNKIVLTVRHPKDTAVSYYNHVKNLKDFYNYAGSFDDIFEIFMGSEIEYGNYYDFYKSWEKVIKNPGNNQILLLKYEDNKADPVGCIKRIAKFLEIDVSDDLAEEIADKTSFNKMKEIRSKGMGGELFRKGTVGDWTNWLSEDQSRRMDERWNQDMQGLSFTY